MTNLWNSEMALFLNPYRRIAIRRYYIIFCDEFKFHIACFMIYLSFDITKVDDKIFKEREQFSYAVTVLAIG